MAKLVVVAQGGKFPLQNPVWARKAGTIQELKVEPKKGRTCEIVALALLTEPEWADFTGDFWTDREYFTEFNRLIKSAGYPITFPACILVTNDGGNSGVVVDTQGYDYARYTCLFERSNNL